MKRIVVLGAGGMLGHKVCQRLRAHQVAGVVRRPASDYAVYPEVFDGVELVGGLDVLQGDALERTLRDLSPDAVINCIGVVKQVEEASDAYLSISINSLLPHRLARWCARAGARLVHLSTDCVFSGTRGSYRETDSSDARDLYGRTKALGETGPSDTAAVTLRTSFIGRELGSPTHGLLEWFLAQDGRAVDGFAGVSYSGLTSIELADVIATILEDNPDLHGLYQVAGPPISKYHLLMLVRDTFGLDVEVRRVESPQSDRSLLGAEFALATGYSPPSWSEMIRRLRDDATPYDEWRSAAGAGS